MTNTTRRKTAEGEVRLGRGRRPQARKLRDAKDALYRAHIMEVAERLFADRGFDETRMQDIAAEAGISLGTLYQWHESKRDLHRSLLIDRDNEMMGLVLAHGATRLQAVLSPRSVEPVLAFMRIHLQFMLGHPAYLRLQLKEGHAWYHQSAQPTATEQELWQRGLEMLAQQFRGGIERGLFVPGDPYDHGRALMAMQQVRLANWVLGGMAEPHAAVIARAQTDFVRLFCRPQVAAALLTTDGSGLNDRTLQRITELSTA